MNAKESQVRLSAARIEIDCAHGDCLSIEAAVIGTNPEASQSSFLRVSAAYMLGAGYGASDATADVCAGFATGYRGLVGDEIAALIRHCLMHSVEDAHASSPGAPPTHSPR